MNREGQKVYTTDVVINTQEFAGSRNEAQEPAQKGQPMPKAGEDGFMNIPDGIDDELPFS